MKIQKIVRIIVILLVLLLPQVVSYAQTSLDKQKAKLLYDLPIHLRWENDDEIDVIKIGVLNGSQAFIKELKSVTRGGYDNIILIDVISFTSVANITETHILYVPKTQNSQFNNIKRKILGFNTALVSEEYPAKKSIMINLIAKGSKLTFQINSANLKAANVNVTQGISRLGGINISTKTLYDESEKSLKQEKQKVRRLQASIETKQKELAKKEKEIERQKEVLFSQGDQIVEQRGKIQVQLAELDKLVSEAKIAKQELQKKTEILHEKERAIRKQEDRIAKQIDVLDKLENDISGRQKQIELQNKEIRSQGIEIRTQMLRIKFQQNVLLIFISLLVIILLLTIFIFRGYRRKRRDNKLLAEQKEEIAQQAVELEAINKELEKLSIVASETSTAVIILDTQGNFDWINIGFTKMYGYTLKLLHEELNGNIIKASNNPDIENLFNSCITDKAPVIYESYVITRDKKEKWAQSTLSPILNSEGEVTKLVLIDSDITKIKEAENEILRQNQMILDQATELESKNIELEKLSLVASKTDNSVVIADLNGEIEWVNDGFTRLLGTSFDEFREEYGTNLFLTSLNPNIVDQIAEGIAYKKSINYTSKTFTKTNRLIWIQTTMTPIFDNKGDVNKFIAIDADVTKIKLAEEEIARQKEKITDSIYYAKKIQTAVLPPKEFLKKLLPEHFIMFRPKDIVSGDFYWTLKKEDKILIAAADCTGHGVPGGFMSMLGMTFLNEITGKLSAEELNAGHILTELRNSVKSSLRQTGKEGEAKDGMDIALCIIDKKTNIMQFAGANSPLFIVRENEQEQEIIDIKADDMPIGIFYHEKEFFTNHTLQLQKGDSCYIFSDGYPDQFGGKKGRKLMLSRFKKMLAASSDKPLSVQKEYIENKFDAWKGKNRQIDDILVIGIRI
ncbi:MAG: YfiR/HmsC family protein [Bacteroidota bacterium]